MQVQGLRVRGLPAPYQGTRVRILPGAFASAKLLVGLPVRSLPGVFATARISAIQILLRKLSANLRDLVQLGLLGRDWLLRKRQGIVTFVTCATPCLPLRVPEFVRGLTV